MNPEIYEEHRILLGRHNENYLDRISALCFSIRLISLSVGLGLDALI